MKDSLECLIELVRQHAPHGTSPRDVADALWLLLTREVTGDETPATSLSTVAAADESQFEDQEEPPDDPDETPGDDPTEEGRSANRPEAEVALTPHEGDLAVSSSPSSPRAARLAASIEVSPRSRLRIARALHAVATRRPAGRLTLDVPRTVQRAAQAKTLLPVFQREVRSSTHLVLLVDAARQLDPWRADVRELLELLDRFRSFASHSALDLDLSEPVTVRIRTTGMTSAEGEASVDAVSVLAAALRPGLDNLVLIVSDAIGKAVGTGALGNVIQSLPSHVRVAWLHPWERKRWGRSAFGELLGRRTATRNRSPLVPVVQFDGDGIQSLGLWAHGRGTGALKSALLPTMPRAPRRPRPREAAVPSSWARKAIGFAATAEWPSVQLLGLAAAVPGWLDLGLLLAMGERFGTEAGWCVERFHVAEVLASGFMERCGQGADLVVRFRSVEAREAALSYLDRPLTGSVLEFLLEHFLTARPGASTARRLMIPLAVIHRLYGDERPAPGDVPADNLREDAMSEGFKVLLPALERLNPTIRADLPWLGNLARRSEVAPTDEAARGDEARRPNEPKTVASSKRSAAARINAHQVIKQVELLNARLKASLHEQLKGDPTGIARLEAEHAEAVRAGRTHEPLASWRDERVDQVAMAWVLTCTFVRFLEDNRCLKPVIERGTESDSHGSERTCGRLKRLLRAIGAQPGMACLLHERWNLLWTLDPTEDGAQLLLDMLGGTEALEPRALADADCDTTFLSQLYERLSEPARARYALIRTPAVVSRFLLDRTLEPAINHHGLAKVRLIDPACGSGTLLLESFVRLVGAWGRAQPDLGPTERVRRAVDQLAGVDQNPAAVAIARFRLLVAALRESGARTSSEAGALSLNITAGDSLLHGPKPGRFVDAGGYVAGGEPLEHAYQGEDAVELRRILGRRYAVVVANPPFVTPKAAAPYSERFASCRGKFSLVVPFVERCMDLAALAPDAASAEQGGWVGIFAANSFMKREFGRKLIEDYLDKVDLTHVIDTSGAYMQGFGTPTVVMLARARSPVASTVRIVRGLRDDLRAPDGPVEGEVWRSICEFVDAPGRGDDYVSVADEPREVLRTHPWTLGDVRLQRLKERLDEVGANRLKDLAKVGSPCDTLADEFFVLPRSAAARAGLREEHVRPFVHGADVGDWSLESDQWIIFPYGPDFTPCAEDFADPRLRRLWRAKSWLSSRRTQAGSTRLDRGRRWYEFSRLQADALRALPTIFFAAVSTHCRFALDREGAIGARSAPGVKLPPAATEDDHLALLAVLNSSTACFWFKQVAQKRGGQARISARNGSPLPWFDLSSMNVEHLPIPEGFTDLAVRRRLVELAGTADACARQLRERSARSAVAEGLATRSIPSTWQRFRAERARLKARLVALQEEIDFTVYALYGLVSESLPTSELSDFDGIEAVSRPFEILAQSSEDSDHTDPEIPADWPESLQSTWRARLDAILRSPQLRLLEVSDYKRQWGPRPRRADEEASELEAALRSWILDRLEEPSYWPEPRYQSVAQLASRGREDVELLYVAELLWAGSNVDLVDGVAALVRDEVVPILSYARYTSAAIEKRRAWEETWRLQHIVDSVQRRMELPVDHSKHLSPDILDEVFGKDLAGHQPPPAYGKSDFKTRAAWRLRGKFDLPLERFLWARYAELETDATPVLGWAGWSTLERAQALRALYLDRKERGNWDRRRLMPLLVGLSELAAAWPSPADSVRPGEDLQHFVGGELRQLGVDKTELTSWRPVTEVDRAFLRGVEKLAAQIDKSQLRIGLLFDDLAHDINEIERVGDLERACEDAFSPRILRGPHDPRWIRLHHANGTLLDRRLARAVQHLAQHTLAREAGLPFFLSIVTADVRQYRKTAEGEATNADGFEVVAWSDQHGNKRGRRKRGGG